MLAGIRLLRRIGLAVGAFMFVFAFPGPYNRLGMAFGIAILAFFLPRVEATSFETKDK
jgi:hypothetical protein